MIGHPQTTGLCACGCGEQTTIAKKTDTSKGRAAGQPVRYIIGHNMRHKLPPYVIEDRGYTTPCWIWRLNLTSAGYGQYRSLYEHHIGPVPDDLELDHLCRVRACVNPGHLEPVTHAENMRRGIRATQTHCTNGHEFTQDNTYVKPTVGTRACKQCQRDRQRRYYQERCAAAGRAMLTARKWDAAA